MRRAEWGRGVGASDVVLYGRVCALGDEVVSEEGVAEGVAEVQRRLALVRCIHIYTCVCTLVLNMNTRGVIKHIYSGEGTGRCSAVWPWCDTYTCICGYMFVLSMYTHGVIKHVYSGGGTGKCSAVWPWCNTYACVICREGEREGERERERGGGEGGGMDR